MIGCVEYICMECKGVVTWGPDSWLPFIRPGWALSGLISWPSFRCFLQPHQLSNQEWCHAPLPGLSGGPPGDRPVPGQGLSGRFQHQSQRRDDVSPRCCADGPQHGHRVAGVWDGKRSSWMPLIPAVSAHRRAWLTSLASVLRWAARRSAWRTATATGPRPCTLRPAGATPRSWAGCCCTAGRSSATAGAGPRFTTRQRTVTWRCVGWHRGENPWKTLQNELVGPQLAVWISANHLFWMANLLAFRWPAVLTKIMS